MGSTRISGPFAGLTRMAAAWAVVLQCIWAFNSGHGIVQYGHTAWSNSDGRLPGGVYSLTQTRDGWLWVGTEFGLFRFDGVRFLPLDLPSGEATRGQSITALAPATDGGLWVGTRKGVSHWNGSIVQHFPAGDRFTETPVSAIHADRSGKIWVGTLGFDSGGLARVEGAGLHFYTRAEGFNGGGVTTFVEDRRGNLWIGSVTGLYRWNFDGFQEYEPNGTSKTISAIAETLGGEIVVGAYAHSGLHLLTRGGAYKGYPIGKSSSRVSTRVLLTDSGGGMWLGTNGEGLLHIQDGRVEQFTHAGGLSGDIVLSLFEDREGNIWAGTERGLDRFCELPVTILTKREGLSNDAAGSVFASRSGGVWIGTSAGLNRVDDGDRITVFDRRAGLPSESVGSVYEDRLGRLWVGSPIGLLFRSQGRFRLLDVQMAVSFHSISAATEDLDGVLWFADRARGMISVHNGEIRKIIPWSAFDNKQGWALEADLARGGLFIGFAQGGVAFYQDGLPVRWYDTRDGLGAGAVTDIQIDREGSAWIATQGGLSRLHDGQVSTLKTTNGLACDKIHSLVEDRDGSLWLNTPCGLQFLARKELNAWVANPSTFVHSRIYAADDGMHLRSATSGFFRRAARSTDGRLWFPVFDGVAVIDPAHLRENPLPPPVAIERLRVDDEEYSATSNLRVGPIGKELQIDYTALSYVAPERVQFRYKLEGYEDQWRSVLGRRQAFYSRLPPGQYRFRVTACNNSGLWNEKGALLDFVVAPTVYQTAWFRLLCLMGAAITLWSIHYVRVRYVEAKMRSGFEERLHERTRIGRELHDTLLQNIAGVALQLDGLAKIVTKQPESAEQRLCELRKDTEHLLHEARESVWNLRSATDGSQDFCGDVHRAGKQIIDGTPVQFSMAVSGSRRAVPPQVHSHLLRIVQEAVRNAVRHADPREVHVDLLFSAPCQMQIRIRDDGCGFDLATALRQSGHWGLANMRERAEQVGAEITFATALGQGTQIEITIRNLPLPHSPTSYA